MTIATTAKEHPIRFNTAMVRAILDGSKTQTRRVLKVPANLLDKVRFERAEYAETSQQRQCGVFWGMVGDIPVGPPIACPYGQPGDRLWVREAFAFTDTHCPEYEGSVDYRADGKCYAVQSNELHDVPSMLDPWKGPWKPSIHMPRWASRILLEIVSVRVERLQDISEADARAEGARRFDAIPVGELKRRDPDRWSMESPADTDECLTTARAAFGNYFCKVNGKTLHGVLDTSPWGANPWVWVVEFKRVAA